MSSARPGKPLFELLDRDRSRDRAQDRAALLSDRVPSAEATPGERSAISVSTSVFYLAIAGVLGLLVLVWVLGYRSGRSSAEAAIARELRAAESPVLAIRDPLADTGGTTVVPPAVQTTPGRSVGPGGAATPNPSANRPRTGVGGGSSATVPGGNPGVTPGEPGPPRVGEVLVAGNRLGPDPRQAGFNYLELATLDREQAASAIDFLTAENLRTVGIPVGRDRFRLLCVQMPVPSEQYRTTGTERSRLQQAVAAAGARWRKEQRGGSDFSQTFWTKYAPKEP